MPKRIAHNSIRLLATLTLLAALLAITPTSARAAGAVRCDASAAGMSHAPLAQATESHKAGLVIDFGDGRVMTFCIDLGDDGQATGEEVLRASGLPMIIDYGFGMGGAVCKIDTVGSDFPAEPCFSHCTLGPGESCVYWVYSQLVGDHWQFLQVGASNIIYSGDVYGWAWGESSVQNGAKPPVRTLAEICPPATVTPTASPTLPPTATSTAILPPAAPPPPTTTPYVARVITATPTASATPTSTPIPSPVIAPAAPTSAPVQAVAPTALPAPSQPSPLPQPTVMPSATPLPIITSTLTAEISRAPLPTATPASRSSGGSTRIQLPLIQHAIAISPSETPHPTARVKSASATATSVQPTAAPVTPTPPRQAAPANDPTRNYPYFGGITAFLLAGWVMLRRGRRSP